MPQKQLRLSSPQPTPPPRDPRHAAWRILAESETNDVFATDQLDDLPNDWSPRDKALTRELTLGVLRRRMTLDATLATFCRKPQPQVEPDLWQLLRLGAYQLMYLDRIPPHAAVHETVQVARLSDRDRWCNFANGILRAIARAVQDSPGEAAPRRSYPVDVSRFREFDRDIFTDPNLDRLANCSQRFNLPRWLLARWDAQFPESSFRAILHRDLHPPTITLRVNALKTDRDTVLAQLTASDLSASAGDLPEAILLDQRAAPQQLPGLAQGQFSIQDQTPMRAACWLDPPPGANVLDLCAAPGTKTAHLAERMQDRGTISATDISADRLHKVQQTVRRLGLTCVTTQTITRDGTDIPDGPFDAILIDAPCSNTGVIAKRVEVRHRLRESDILELAIIQQQLLNRAAVRLAPSGRLLYSTCSLEPEENENNVRTFLAAHPGFELLREELFVPGPANDGGYLALMQRAEP